MTFYQVDVYAHDGRYLGPIKRPCWCTEMVLGRRQKNLVWKTMVYRTFKRAIRFACGRNDQRLLHNVSEYKA